MKKKPTVTKGRSRKGTGLYSVSNEKPGVENTKKKKSFGFVTKI